MSRTTKVLLTVFAVAVVALGVRAVVGTPVSSSVRVDPPKTTTSVDPGKIGSVEVVPSDGLPDTGHNH